MRSGRNPEPMISSFLSMSNCGGVVFRSPRMFERSAAWDTRDHQVDKNRCRIGGYSQDALQATNLEAPVQNEAIRMFRHSWLSMRWKRLPINAFFHFYKSAGENRPLANIGCRDCLISCKIRRHGERSRSRFGDDMPSGIASLAPRTKRGWTMDGTLPSDVSANHRDQEARTPGRRTVILTRLPKRKNHLQFRSRSSQMRPICRHENDPPQYEGQVESWLRRSAPSFRMRGSGAFSRRGPPSGSRYPRNRAWPRPCRVGEDARSCGRDPTIAPSIGKSTQRCGRARRWA